MTKQVMNVVAYPDSLNFPDSQYRLKAIHFHLICCVKAYVGYDMDKDKKCF